MEASPGPRRGSLREAADLGVQPGDRLVERAHVVVERFDLPVEVSRRARAPVLQVGRGKGIGTLGRGRLRACAAADVEDLGVRRDGHRHVLAQLVGSQRALQRLGRDARHGAGRDDLSLRVQVDRAAGPAVGKRVALIGSRRVDLHSRRGRVRLGRDKDVTQCADQADGRATDDDQPPAPQHARLIGYIEGVGTLGIHAPVLLATRRVPARANPGGSFDARDHPTVALAPSPAYLSELCPVPPLRWYGLRGAS